MVPTLSEAMLDSGFCLQATGADLTDRAVINGVKWARVHERRPCVSFPPKPLGDLQCVDLQILPPDHLIAGLMQLPMMTAAKGYGELVADFEAQGSRLRKSQVIRIGRLAPADQAWL
jgi:hypothetical protein